MHLNNRIIGQLIVHFTSVKIPENFWITIWNSLSVHFTPKFELRNSLGLLWVELFLRWVVNHSLLKFYHFFIKRIKIYHIICRFLINFSNQFSKFRVWKEKNAVPVPLFGQIVFEWWSRQSLAFLFQRWCSLNFLILATIFVIAKLNFFSFKLLFLYIFLHRGFDCSFES